VRPYGSTSSILLPANAGIGSIEDALQNCCRLLVVLSPAAVDSNNVMDEVSNALEEQKRVVPILYQHCTVPFRLRRLQYADFQLRYQEGLAALIRVLDVPPSSPAPERPELRPQPATAPKPQPPQPSPTTQPTRSVAPPKAAKEAQETDGRVSNPIRSALNVLRAQTKYLWLDLVELGPGRDTFATEIQEDTYNNVRAALDDIAYAGHFRYSTEPKYVFGKGSLVLNIKVSHITTQLLNLVRQIEADGPPREIHVHRDQSDPGAYGDG
jgi:hypothetical protein